MKSAAIVIGLSFLLLLSSFTLLTNESSADPISVDLLYDDGSKIPEDEPIITETLIFTTFTDETGTTTYCLEAETELTEIDCYLRISSEGGTFIVTSLIPGKEISGALKDSGLLIRLTHEDDVFEARLVDNTFEGKFMNGGAPAILLPNVLYKMDIFTESQI